MVPFMLKAMAIMPMINREILGIAIILHFFPTDLYSAVNSF